MRVVRNMAGAVLLEVRDDAELRDVREAVHACLGTQGELVCLVDASGRPVEAQAALLAGGDLTAVLLGVRVECAWCRRKLGCRCGAAEEACPCVEDLDRPIELCEDCELAVTAMEHETPPEIFASVEAWCFRDPTA